MIKSRLLYSTSIDKYEFTAVKGQRSEAFKGALTALIAQFWIDYTPEGEVPRFEGGADAVFPQYGISFSFSQHPRTVPSRYLNFSGPSNPC